MESDQEVMRKLLEEQRKEIDRLTSILETRSVESSERRSPEIPNSPTVQGRSKSEAQSRQSVVQYFQPITEARSMNLDEDIEDYLSHFTKTYRDIELADGQLLVKLMQKLPKHQSQFLEGLMDANVSFEEAKKALTEQYGIATGERKRRFNSMQYIEGQDLMLFIQQAEKLLAPTKLTPSQIGVKITEKLPAYVQNFIDVSDTQNITLLLQKVKQLKSSNIFALLAQGVQQLSTKNPIAVPVFTSEIQQPAYKNNYNSYYNNKGRYNNKNSEYTYSGFNKKPSSSFGQQTDHAIYNQGQQKDTSSNTGSSKADQQQQQQTEVKKAVRFEGTEKEIKFCGLEKEDSESEKEAYVQTRAYDYGDANRQGTSSGVKQEDEQNMDADLQAKFDQRKKRQYTPNFEEQQNQQNFQFTQGAPNNTNIVFGQSEVCDSQGRVNLTGLMNKIEIKLPLHTYLALNNQEIVTKDPLGKPVNIYAGDMNKFVKFNPQESGDRLSKIVIPVQLNSVTLQGIIDTGAEYTLLSTQGAKKAKIEGKINRQTKDKVKGIAGTQRVFGYLPDHAIYIGGAKVKLDLATLEEGSFDILIGRDILFCGLQNLILDSKQKQISFIFNNQEYRLPYKNIRNRTAASKEAWFSETIVQGQTLKQKEQVLQDFKGYPINKKYNFFYGDLPLSYPKFHTSELPYRTTSLKKLKRLPIRQQSERDSVCLLWTGGPRLPQMLDIMEEWGFKYRTILLVWCKQSKKFLPVNGLGYWSRASTELLLLGAKGCIAKFKSPLLNVNQYLETILLKTVRKGHSEKPEQVYDLLRKIFDVKVIEGIELFGRKRAANNDFLDVYGDGIENHFDELEVTNEAQNALEREVTNILLESIFANITINPFKAVQNRIQGISKYIQGITVRSKRDQEDSTNENVMVHLEPKNEYIGTINTIKNVNETYAGQINSENLSNSSKNLSYENVINKSESKANENQKIGVDSLRSEQTSNEQAINLMPNEVEIFGVQKRQKFKSKVSRQKAFKIQIEKNILHASKLKLMTDQNYQSLNIPNEMKEDPKVRYIFDKYAGIFSFDGSFGYTNVMKYDITLKQGARPVKQKQRKLPELHKVFVAEQIKMLKEKNLIVETDSDWVAPLVIVPKKGGKLRMCIDYRLLNENTVKVKYWSPYVYEDIINYLKVEEAQWFVVLDLLSGYWQVLLEKDSVLLSAFTCHLGTFACHRLQFGLTNAVAFFQKLMNTALGPLLGKACFVYIDDIVVFGRTKEHLLENLQEVFELLQKAQLTLSPQKCEFFMKEVQLLGQVIGHGMVRPQPDKLKVLTEFREPRTIKEIQQFLGLINYFRNYVPNVAELSYPIQKLVGKKTTFKWGETQQQSFAKLKEILSSGLFLYIPKRAVLLIVHVTVTTIAYSGMLFQEVDEQLQPLQFVSKVLPELWIKQDMELREVRAVVSVIKEWQHYLQGRHFRLETDVQSIHWALNSKYVGKTFFEQNVFLEQFDFELKQRSQNQLRHLKALIMLNKELDWVYHMDNTLSLEAKLREQEVTLKKEMVKVNPLTKEKLSEFDYIAYTDGACRKRKGGAMGAAAYILYNSKHEVKASNAQPVEVDVSNNVCEYSALHLLLSYLAKQRLFKCKILVVMDAQLVVNHVNKTYRVGNEVLAPHYREVMKLMRYFKRIEVVHVPREFNTKADTLAKNKLQDYIRTKEETNQATKVLPQVLEAYNVVQEDEMATQKCEVCGEIEPIDTTLLCDHCAHAYHMHCVSVNDFPIGNWYCNSCLNIIRDLNENDSDLLDPYENENLRAFLENPQVAENLTSEQAELIKSMATHFGLSDGHLCYRTVKGYRRIPSVGERALVVRQIHQAMGHYGYTKTLDMVKQCYWWPNMAKLVQDMVKKCLLCQANHAKYPQLRQAYTVEKGIRPFTHVTVDLFYLPETTEAFRYVVTAIDSFTKWPEATALQDRDSKTMAEFIHRDVVCRYGCPVAIRTDNGGEFMGHFHEYLRSQNIQHIVGTPYHPESQGQVERMHNTIKNGIRKLFNTLEYRDSWNYLLPNVLLGIRTSVSRATKFSPSQLLLGKDLVLPNHQVVQTQVEYEEPTPEQVENYFNTFVSNQESNFNTVYQHLATMDTEIKQTIDRRRKRTPKDMDSEDMLLLKHESHNALDIDAQGPMIFIEYTDPERNAVRYLDPRTRIYGRASVANIKVINV